MKFGEQLEQQSVPQWSLREFPLASACSLSRLEIQLLPMPAPSESMSNHDAFAFS
jgi:hypothetical protein